MLPVVTLKFAISKGNLKKFNRGCSADNRRRNKSMRGLCHKVFKAKPNGYWHR